MCRSKFTYLTKFLEGVFVIDVTAFVDRDHPIIEVRNPVHVSSQVGKIILMCKKPMWLLQTTNIILWPEHLSVFHVGCICLLPHKSCCGFYCWDKIDCWAVITLTCSINTLWNRLRISVWKSLERISLIVIIKEKTKQTYIYLFITDNGFIILRKLIN